MRLRVSKQLEDSLEEEKKKERTKMNSLLNGSDATKIGVGLTGLGIFFFFLGLVLLLDSVLLTMGNLLFIVGISMIMGPSRSMKFFYFRRRASFFFFLGVFLVLMRWCLLGLTIQGFGMLNLFRNFIPMLLSVLGSIPFIGSIFNSSIFHKFKHVVNADAQRSGGRNV